MLPRMIWAWALAIFLAGCDQVSLVGRQMIQSSSDGGATPPASVIPTPTASPDPTRFGVQIFRHGLNGAGGGAASARNDRYVTGAIDSQNRYIAALATVGASGGTVLALVRYLPDGTLDPSFGGVGYTVFGAGIGAAGASGASQWDFPYQLLVAPGDRYFIAGYSANAAGGRVATVWCINPDGTPSREFGHGRGYILLQASGNGLAGAVGANQFDMARTLNLDSRGRLVLTGESENAMTPVGDELFVARVYIDGTIDTSFGNGGSGYALFHHDQPSAAGSDGIHTRRSDCAGAATLDSGDAIYITGWSRDLLNTSRLFVMKYGPSGVLDKSFGGGTGFVVFDNNGKSAAGAPDTNRGEAGNTIAIAGSGDLLIGGESMDSQGGENLVVWSYSPGGSLTSFGGQGFAVFQSGGNGTAGALDSGKVDQPLSAAWAANGSLVISGTSIDSNAGHALALWRWAPGGQMTATVYQPNGPGAAGGKGMGKSDVGMALAIDKGSKQIVFGISENENGNSELTLWAYLADGTLD